MKRSKRVKLHACHMQASVSLYRCVYVYVYVWEHLRLYKIMAVLCGEGYQNLDIPFSQLCLVLCKNVFQKKTCFACFLFTPRPPPLFMCVFVTFVVSVCKVRF